MAVAQKFPFSKEIGICIYGPLFILSWGQTLAPGPHSQNFRGTYMLVPEFQSDHFSIKISYEHAAP
jgi:hypothetical protein